MGGRCRTVLRGLKQNILLILMILAMVVGIALGLGLRYVQPPLTKRDIFYLKFPGDLLLQMLKMLILPLVISSLISGIAALDLKQSGRIGLRAIVYYLTTTFIAVVIGILLVVTIQPGTRGSKDDVPKAGKAKIVNTADALLDLLRVSFPDNLIEACFLKRVTQQIEVEVKETEAKINETMNMTEYNSTLDWSMNMNQNSSNETTEQVNQPKEYDPKVGPEIGMNVLGLVVFSIFFGCVVSRMGERGKILKDFFEALNEATMQLITLAIWYSPIGVLFLIAAKVVEMEDPEIVFSQLGYYCLTVIAGLIIHGYLVLPLIFFIATRKNPYKFIYGMLQAIVTALATASSSATLPVTMSCLEERNKVDLRIAKFVAPIGATINMDGTALYEAVASIFIAQINGITLGVGQVITVSVTATAAAIGAAGVPQAGLVTMVIVLTAVGLPTDDVTLILAIDWFLDRCRTSVNVLGDALGAGIIHALSSKELEKMNDAETRGNGYAVEDEKRKHGEPISGGINGNEGQYNPGFKESSTTL